jgi:hypothetical protein
VSHEDRRRSSFPNVAFFSYLEFQMMEEACKILSATRASSVGHLEQKKYQQTIA